MERWQRAGLEALAVLAAVGFVVTLTYVPHLDTTDDQHESPAFVELATAVESYLEGDREGYPYPLHVDEHIHWVRMSAVQRQDTVRIDDPYTGEAWNEGEFSLRGNVHETGFWLGFAQFQEMTGLHFLTIFQFAPALWAGLIALIVWGALRPWPGAPIAAAFTGLMPTTVRFLGPGFLVPITFGLAWVAGLLMLLRHVGRGPRYAMMALAMTIWAFFIHVIAGFVCLFLLLAALPAAGRDDVRTVGGLAIAALLPMIWLYEAFFEELLTEVQTLNTLPIDFTIFDQAGLPFLVAWILGAGLVMYRAPDRHSLPVRSATLLSAVLMGVILSNFYIGSRLALYDRFHQPFVLLASVPVAYLVLAAGRLVWHGLGALVENAWRPGRAAAAGLAGLVLAIGLLSPGVSAHLDEPYYHVVDDEDMERFRWIEANVDDPHEVFLAHPWKAPILTAMTGMEPYTVLTPGSPPINGQDYIDYLTGRGGSDTWLVERSITVVAADRPPTEAERYETRGPGVAVAEPSLAHEIAEIRQLRQPDAGAPG